MELAASESFATPRYVNTVTVAAVIVSVPLYVENCWPERCKPQKAREWNYAHLSRVFVSNGDSGNYALPCVHCNLHVAQMLSRLIRPGLHTDVTTIKKNKKNKTFHCKFRPQGIIDKLDNQLDKIPPRCRFTITISIKMYVRDIFVLHANFALLCLIVWSWFLMCVSSP